MGALSIRDWPGIPRNGRYADSSLRPRGHAAAPGYCLAEVMPDMWHPAQCSRRAVTDGLCRQHHKKAAAWLAHKQAVWQREDKRK